MTVLFVFSWFFVAAFLGGPIVFSLQNCKRKKPRLDYSTYMDATFSHDRETIASRPSDYQGGNIFSDIDLQPRDPSSSIQYA
jgi:hypothetical protein